ncbi:hypothetical protein L3X38_000086 [Prunus dulcis]|uniref:Uncharacterized protein n=1 Tax=Prunus dulcis TaxID=3755 RepID=A0AAD4YJV0_PRUDU|nr:hypothetical protein L3X38_000086 [Prunus dulcis]
MTPQEIRAVRASRRSRGEKVRVLPYDPSTLLMTEQEESSMRHTLVHYQSEAMLETTADEPSDPGLNPWSDVPAADETQALPPVSPVPPYTSGSHLRSKDKGKAPLEEYDVEESDEDEDEMPLQRKRGASVLSTRDADFDSVLRDAGSKRARVESSPDVEETSLVGPDDVPQVSGPFVVKESKMVTLKVGPLSLKKGLIFHLMSHTWVEIWLQKECFRGETLFSRVQACQELNLTSTTGKRIVMELRQPDMIAVDNKLPLTVSANYQTLCSPTQLVALAKRNLSSGLDLSTSKAPILVQRRQNLRRIRVPLSLASKIASLSRARDSRTAPLAFPYLNKKRLQLEEVDDGDGAHGQSEDGDGADGQSNLPFRSFSKEMSDEPESDNVVPDPIVEPVARSEDGVNFGTLRVEGSGTPAMSKERAKMDFASSFENAKSDLLALADKFKHSGPAQSCDDLAQLEVELALSRDETKAQHEELEKYELLLKESDWRLRTSKASLPQVLLQMEELQDEADQMLTTLAAIEDINKADMEIGVELWHEKLRKIRLDKIRVDTRHFAKKIKTLLDLLV